MKTQKAFLLLNGEQPKTLPNIEAYKIVCATDDAYSFLKESGVIQ